jgi:glycosyltransferase involved in cell wall biosynthesis
MYFSIVIPCYNNAKTLGRTLDSVLAQRNFLKEVILIDDGSVDDTALIVQPYLTQYASLIQYHVQKNAGPANARNHGAHLATADYVMFLDADDTLCERALEAFVSTFEKEPSTQLIIAGYCAVHDTYRKDRFLKPYPNREALLKALWFGEFSINGGMAAIRAPVLRTIQYPETIRHGEDIVFFSHIIAQVGARILPNLSVNIYHHPDSLRNQQASILKDQDALIALLFDPQYLTPSLMSYQHQFHANKLISLAKTASRIDQKPLAKQFLKKAFLLHPQSFLSIKTLKVCLRAW